MKPKYLMLAAILFLATFLRFYQISSNPPALFADEVDAGYQAMVLNANGTDYFGNPHPTSFHSFADYRTSADIYTIAFFQKLGFNPEISVRLPSAFFSLASVLVFYLITGSLIGAFLMAISPYSIQYGRSGFEVSGMIFCLLIGIYLWKKYLQHHKFILLTSSFLFYALSVYFYSTAKFFIFILFFITIFIWRQEIFKIPFKHLSISVILTIIFLLPMLFDTISGHSGFRFSYISIFTEPHRDQITNALRYQDTLISHPNEIGVHTSLFSSILHNKYQLVFQKFVTNYLSSFSTSFLFLVGDQNSRHGFGGHGLFYLADFFFLIYGLFLYFKKPDKLSTLFFWMLIFAPIPFALTRDSTTAHATRLILLLPPIIYFVTTAIKQKPILLVLYLFLFLNFWHYYTVHYPQDSALYWHSNIKETLLATKKYPNSNIYFSDVYEPFLPFFLFYQPYLPSVGNASTHLSHLSTSYFDGSTIDSKYYFGHINWNGLNPQPNNIYVIPQDELGIITNLSDYNILERVHKHFQSAQDFYLLSPKIK